MIQVPTSWLREIKDLAQLTAEWDAMTQSILDLFGVNETYKTMLYVLVDTILHGDVISPG